MSSRGAVAQKRGPGLDTEYRTSKVFNCGAKLLEGVSKKYHSLPDYSHSKNAVYVKFSDGILER